MVVIMSGNIVIFGPSGLVGGAALRHFDALPDWNVTALSRRPPAFEHGGRFIPPDLTDRAACEGALGELTDTTPIIYTALYDDVAEAREKAVAEMSYRYDQDFDPLVDKYAAFGPPERVAERLAEFIDAGVNYFILAPIMPPAERSQHLQRMAEEVLPALEKMTPGKIL